VGDVRSAIARAGLPPGYDAVIGGAYEMGKGSLIASLVAHLKGLPLTIVGNGAVWDPKSPFSLMVAAADSPVKSGADLNGKTLSTAALRSAAWEAGRFGLRE